MWSAEDKVLSVVLMVLSVWERLAIHPGPLNATQAVFDVANDQHTEEAKMSLVSGTHVPCTSPSSDRARPLRPRRRAVNVPFVPVVRQAHAVHDTGMLVVSDGEEAPGTQA